MDVETVQLLPCHPRNTVLALCVGEAAATNMVDWVRAHGAMKLAALALLVSAGLALPTLMKELPYWVGLMACLGVTPLALYIVATAEVQVLAMQVRTFEVIYQVMLSLMSMIALIVLFEGDGRTPIIVVLYVGFPILTQCGDSALDVRPRTLMYALLVPILAAVVMAMLIAYDRIPIRDRSVSLSLPKAKYPLQFSVLAIFYSAQGAQLIFSLKYVVAIWLNEGEFATIRASIKRPPEYVPAGSAATQVSAMRSSTPRSSELWSASLKPGHPENTLLASIIGPKRATRVVDWARARQVSRIGPPAAGISVVLGLVGLMKVGPWWITISAALVPVPVALYILLTCQRQILRKQLQTFNLMYTALVAAIALVAVVLMVDADSRAFGAIIYHVIIVVLLGAADASIETRPKAKGHVVLPILTIVFFFALCSLFVTFGLIPIRERTYTISLPGAAFPFTTTPLATTYSAEGTLLLFLLKYVVTAVRNPDDFATIRGGIPRPPNYKRQRPESISSEGQLVK